MLNNLSTRILSVALAWCGIGLLLAQPTESEKLNLENLYKNNVFKPDYIYGIRSMKDGEHFTLLERGALSKVVQYRYKDFEKVRDVVSSAKLPGFVPIDSYSFTEDESYVMIATEEEQIYRRSSRAKYYLYNRKKEEATLLADGKVTAPALSLDNARVAYIYQNNIYIRDLATGDVQQITEDGKTNEVINGLADWVYEEEFSIVRCYQWSPDGRYLAYIKFREKDVPEFSMDVFGSGLYPSQYRFKYPKAGEKNAEVSLHLYDLETKETHTLLQPEGEEVYIPRIQWSKEKGKLSVITTNRHQNKVNILLIDAKTKEKKVAYTETSDTYIDINEAKLIYLADNSFLWLSDKSGYMHLYHIDEGKQTAITKGKWEVTDFYGYNEEEEVLYYQSTEPGSIHRAVYRIDLDGDNKKLLSQREGTNEADFSAGYQYFINTFSDANTPYVFELCNGETGKPRITLKDNERLSALIETNKLTDIEFMDIKVGEATLNAYMMKPADFDPKKKYPVFMFVYGGPGSQTVNNQWSQRRLWFHMLTQAGYIVVSVDNRGTGYRGRDFKKMTYLSLGKYEIEDQISAAKYLSTLPYVDEDRIGMFGWSYGGFMTSLALTRGGGLFKMGIAVAPVTNWRFYDTIYTERYMRTPQENADGYDDNSPVTYADQLTGNYLLIHGSGDDNVHYQNTMAMVEALVQADKQFDLFIYPDKNHGIYGGNTTYHLYKKMTDYILRNL